MISRLSMVSGRDMREGSITTAPHALHAAPSRHSRHSRRLRNGQLSVRVEEQRKRAKIPRLTFSARSAAAVIFILVLALSCSVTLLVIQGANNFSYPTSSGVPVASAPSRSSSAESSSLPPSHSNSRSRAPSSSRSQNGHSTNDAASSSARSSSQNSSEKNSSASTSASPCSTGVCADGKININAASSQQLQTVSGIGPSTAQKIIDYRKEHGNYTTVDALINVPGIGPKKLAKMRDSLVAN